MKKTIVSAGLVAVSTVGLQAQWAPGLSRLETMKPWSVSAALRGFYDDNWNTAPSSPSSPFVPKAEDSFGIEVSPAVSLNHITDQTLLRAGYVYSMKWFETRNQNSADHSHEFTGKVDHRFSERYRVILDESFVYTQEPQVVAGTATDGFLTGVVTRRTKGDVLRNRVSLDFNGEVTPIFGVGAGYKNTWYDYQDTGAFSHSAFLDRIEHLFRLDGRYLARTDLTAVIGYQFGIVDHTSGDVIAIAPVMVRGRDRDNTSHYVYVGGEYALSKQLRTAARIGAQFTDYDELKEENWSPFVDVNLIYDLLPGQTWTQVGVRHARNAADRLALDQESTSVYASLSHKITPRITGSLLGQYQHSTFNDGPFDGDADNFYVVGLNLDYRINQHLATEVGYNFDRLDSDLRDRSFTRNRVYVGVRATY